MLIFHKYHGAGNDFIMINNLQKNISLNSRKISFLCNRNIGIGADGLILLESSKDADCFMNYYNSNGTEAQMCGNGVRCTAKFYQKQTNLNKKRLKVDTRDGIKDVLLNEDETYSVNMGTPLFKSKDFPTRTIKIENIDFNLLSLGNPHAVTIVDDVSIIDIKKAGPSVENNKNFPNKINVEFVEKINHENYKVRVWERGCGETLSCGTGACAVYTILKKKDEKIVNLILQFPGGFLSISQNTKGEIILTGPAEFVFKGKIK